jgi:hypothetical protein
LTAILHRDHGLIDDGRRGGLDGFLHGLKYFLTAIGPTQVDIDGRTAAEIAKVSIRDDGTGATRYEKFGTTFANK